MVMGFAVRRTSRSYVRPSAPTPSGTLELSGIDRVVGMRHLVRSLHVFAPAREGLPAGGEHPPPRVVIQEALGKALVDYYPMAGRLVDGPEGPVSARVACTGEGAWFLEAAAECSLEDAGLLDRHPFAIPEGDLLPDAAPGVDPLDIPLMMQVTEFACGGFVVGLMSSHTMTDGLGAGQFLNAIGDYARGLPKPRVAPIWARDLVPNPPKLLSRPPPFPRVFQFRYLTVDLSVDSIDEVKSQFLASTGQRCSTFDVVVAKVWQARTRSLRLPDPSTQVKLCFFANARHLLPKDGAGADGFYGNCFYPVRVTAESGAVEGADLGGVVGMVRDAKARLPEEFARWAAGELVEDDPFELSFTYESLFMSEWKRLGFLETDYGWGAPSHVVPFAALPCMPVALIGAPPAPGTGIRITTQCLEEDHVPAFREEIKAFEM
ncbi:hypothetical protein ACP70R_030055 [Stipagrostis hirtigluma subsp. patula]